MLLRLKLWAGAVIAALATIVGVWFAGKREGKQGAKAREKQKDFEHAEDIESRVSRSRADPDRLRKYEGRGYRD